MHVSPYPCHAIYSVPLSNDFAQAKQTGEISAGRLTLTDFEVYFVSA